MSFYNYDAKQVAIVFGGILYNEGFGDGQFLNMEMDTEQFTKKAGTDGCVTRSKSNNLMATATITLLQGSPLNDALTAMMIADQNAPNGAGVASFRVVDLNGTSVHYAQHAWIEKWPDISYDREDVDREWVLGLAKLEHAIGGL